VQTHRKLARVAPMLGGQRHSLSTTLGGGVLSDRDVITIRVDYSQTMC
jgi:hypothetical protein